MTAAGKDRAVRRNDGTSLLQDVWEWDGAAGTWTDARLPGQAIPTLRSRHGVRPGAGQGGRLRGNDGSYTLSDIWEWDGTAGTWTKRTPVGVQPSARDQHAMVYDSMKKKILLFAGDDRSYPLKQDTWNGTGRRASGLSGFPREPDPRSVPGRRWSMTKSG